MDIIRSVSCSSFGTSDSRTAGRAVFGKKSTQNQRMPLRPATGREETGVRVTISRAGLTRPADDNALFVEAKKEDHHALMDLACWIMVIGLGVIMGWSAAGELLS
ncbi:MAG TPA: hypothetical protein VGZ01_01565 [Trinickia sp.]|jgi:hypothetical protein|nr:hypothetical protein [Trinickia sp.]